MRHPPSIRVLSLALVLSACGAPEPGPPAGAEPTARPAPRRPGVWIEVEAADAVAAARRVLGPAAAELRVASVTHSLTAEHVRFVRVAPDGAPVLGSDASVHLRALPATPDGRPRWVARLVTGADALPLAHHGARRLDAGRAGELAAAAAPGGAGAATVLRADPVALPAGPGVARAGWRVLVATPAPAGRWEVWVDGETGAATVARDLLVRAEGTGMVFLPNPIDSTGDRSLVDDGDADSPALRDARFQVVLTDLDGSGLLRGAYADARNPSGRASAPTLVFDYERGHDAFEEVMAYHHVTAANRHLQALGFTGERAILDAPMPLWANRMADDNSWFDPTAGPVGDISLGTGGVDDGEDADVIVHEYGHAINQDVVCGGGGCYYGGTEESGAIGEGFSDIVAASMPTGRPDGAGRTFPTCMAAWDGVGFYVPCLRRVDGTKHYPEHWRGEVHADGEIWSGALWDLFEETGLGGTGGLQLAVEAVFHYPGPTPTFRDGAEALLVAEEGLHGGAHAEAVRRVLTWHGLLSEIEPAVPFDGTPETVTFGRAVSDLPAFEDAWEVVSAPGAAAMRVRFGLFNLRPGDFVYLYDRRGLLYARLTGARGAFYSAAVPGDELTIRWVTDGAMTSSGFRIDHLQAVYPPPPPDAALPDAAPPDAAPPLPDAALPDAAPPDAAPPPPDAASPDTASPDAASPDAAIPAPDAPSADAPPAAPDAAPGTADAPPAVPDAAPGIADARPVDARPATVDAAGGGDEGGPCGCRVGARRGPADGRLAGAALLAGLALAFARRRAR